MAIAIRPCGASIQQSRPDDSTAQSDFSVSVQAFEYVDSFLDRTLMDDIIASWKLSDAQVHVANSLYGEYVAKVVAIEQTARERFATMKVESRQERLERFKREYAAAAAISREEAIRLEEEMRTEGELFQATHREQWKAIHCDAERQSRSELTSLAPSCRARSTDSLSRAI